MKAQLDGNMVHITADDFINLQESESVFVTPEEYKEFLGKEVLWSLNFDFSTLEYLLEQEPCDIQQVKAWHKEMHNKYHPNNYTPEWLAEHKEKNGL